MINSSNAGKQSRGQHGAISSSDEEEAQGYELSRTVHPELREDDDAYDNQDDAGNPEPDIPARLPHDVPGAERAHRHSD